MNSEGERASIKSQTDEKRIKVRISSPLERVDATSVEGWNVPPRGLWHGKNPSRAKGPARDSTYSWQVGHRVICWNVFLKERWLGRVFQGCVWSMVVVAIPDTRRQFVSVFGMTISGNLIDQSV